MSIKEIRIHARAGQGAITAAQILAMAAHADGKQVLAFPTFGAERMGAPMNAFVRLGDETIRLRTQVREPDYVIVQDPTLLKGFNVTDGLRPDSALVINSLKCADELGLATKAKIYTVPASQIAEELLGRADRTNTIMLGAFAAATGEVGLDALMQSIKERFRGPLGEKNAEAARRAYDYVAGHR